MTDLDLDVYNLLQEKEEDSTVVYLRTHGDKYFVYADGDMEIMSESIVKAMEENKEFAGAICEAFAKFMQ